MEMAEVITSYAYAKLLPATLLVAALTGQANAEQGCCCAHCGCAAPCQKVCRLVCEEKKVDVFCWGCKCEEFCLPCHSKPGCRHCETVCNDCATCDPKVPQSEPKRFIWSDWFPSGARIYTRTKLMRKTDTVTVPSYKWVVEDLCAECTARVERSGETVVAGMPPKPSEPATR
jgi:hypothetical protein